MEKPQGEVVRFAFSFMGDPFMFTYLFLAAVMAQQPGSARPTAQEELLTHEIVSYELLTRSVRALHSRAQISKLLIEQKVAEIEGTTHYVRYFREQWPRLLPGVRSKFGEHIAIYSSYCRDPLMVELLAVLKAELEGKKLPATTATQKRLVAKVEKQPADKRVDILLKETEAILGEEQDHRLKELAEAKDILDLAGKEFLKREIEGDHLRKQLRAIKEKSGASIK